MEGTPASPVAIAMAFVERINRRDLAGLVALIDADHRLEAFEEEPVVGKEANADAWRGYFDAFPTYFIYPHQIAERDSTVAIVGHTTGSHLGLPDEEESELTLIWLAETADREVIRWRLIEDTPANRGVHGLDVV